MRGEIILGELNILQVPHSLASVTLADNPWDLGLEIGRFKNGTPPRVKASSINYEETEIQPGDEKPNHFSFLSKDEDYLQDHLVINLYESREPRYISIIYTVQINVFRYCQGWCCPSIEDKLSDCR